MKESTSENLIHAGINFGFGLFFFGILYGVVTCIIKYYTRYDHDNNDDHVTSTIMVCVGIKPYVLQSIPIVDFNAKDFKDGVECVVCLSELVHGDKARVLPTCNHWFHADCIDSWFRSHSTCPICRQRVRSDQPGTRPELVGHEGLAQIHDPRSEHRGFPTDSYPMSTEEAAVEDAVCDGANEGLQDLTAVVIDIPAKQI